MPLARAEPLRPGRMVVVQHRDGDHRAGGGAELIHDHHRVEAGVGRQRIGHGVSGVGRAGNTVRSEEPLVGECAAAGHDGFEREHVARQQEAVGHGDVDDRRSVYIQRERIHAFDLFEVIFDARGILAGVRELHVGQHQRGVGRTAVDLRIDVHAIEHPLNRKGRPGPGHDGDEHVGPVGCGQEVRAIRHDVFGLAEQDVRLDEAAGEIRPERILKNERLTMRRARGVLTVTAEHRPHVLVGHGLVVQRIHIFVLRSEIDRAF